MNRVAAVVSMHWRDKKMWFLLPWLITLGSFTVNAVIGLFMPKGEYIYSGGIASSFVYMFILGIITLAQSFPFALGLSMRRKDYFVGTAVTAMGTSFITAILLYLLSYMENNWTDGWGVQVHFFHLPYLNDGSAIEQILIYFITMLAFFFFGFMISSIYRRFGKMGLLVTAILALLLGTIGSYMMSNFGLWMDLYEAVKPLTAFMLALWLIPAVACSSGLSYLLLRRASVS